MKHKKRAIPTLNILHWKESESKYNKICLILGSLPLITFYEMFKRYIGDKEFGNQDIFIGLDGYDILLIVKIFRFGEIFRFKNGMQNYLIVNRHETIIVAKLLENCVYFVASTHVITCVWMFLYKIGKK